MKKGVSLITLIVTIVVIIILSGIVILSLTNSDVVESSREAKYKNDLKNFDEEIRVAIQKDFIKDQSIISKKITDVNEIKKYSYNLVKSKYIKYSYITEGMLTLRGKMLTSKERKWATEAKIKIDDTVEVEGIVNILLTPKGPTVKVGNIEWTRYNIGASLSYLGEIPEGYILQYKIGDEEFVDYTQEIEIENNSSIITRLYNKQDDDEAASNSKDITTIDKTPPTKPNLDQSDIVVDINKISVKASGSNDLECGLAGYKYSADGINYTKIYNEAEEGKIENLKSNDLYVIYAKAVDYVGNESEQNTVLNVKTLPRPFEVRYDANGGNNAPQSQIKYEAQSLVLTSDVPTKIGYDFVGWSTSSTSNIVSYIPGSTYSKDESITLYAIWSASTNTKYRVNHYTKNIGANTYSLYNTEDKTGTTGEKLQVSSFVKQIPGFTYSNSKVATIEVAEAVVSADGSLVINMYYTRNSYTVTLNKGTGISSVSGAGTYEYGSTVVIDAQVNAGYTWSSWTGTIPNATKTYSFTMPNYNIVNTANASAITYTISYNGNGATSGSTASSIHTYGVAKNLTANGYSKTGYTFTGWNTNADGTGTTYSNSQSVSNLTNVNGSTITLYAIWKVSDIYLYNKGDLCKNVTGGWSTHIYTDKSEKIYNSWSSYGGHFYNYLSNCLQFGDNSTTKYGNGNFYTTNKVDLSLYKYMDIDYKIYNVTNDDYGTAFWIKLLDEKPVDYNASIIDNTPGGIRARIFDTGEVFEGKETFSISGVNGKYYIYLFSASHASVKGTITVEVNSIYLHN